MCGNANPVKKEERKKTTGKSIYHLANRNPIKILLKTEKKTVEEKIPEMIKS